MKEWLKRYVSPASILIMAFVVYVLFINENSVQRNYEYASEIRDLKARIASYEDTLRVYEELNRKLDSDPVELERIVREQYHMQRPSEDVYIMK